MFRFRKDQTSESAVRGMPSQYGGLKCLAALLMIGGIVHASATTSAADNAVTCEIRSESKNGMLWLTAIAHSHHPVSGQYHLIVSKRGESGSSDNAQSGEFTLNQGHDSVLTTTVLDGGAIGHYSARLSIETNAGRVSCHSP